MTGSQSYTCMLPTGQTLNSEYNFNQIEPLTSMRQVTGGPTERKLFSPKKEMTEWSTGSHFKSNSDMVSEEFAKLYSQGRWLASELS